MSMIDVLKELCKNKTLVSLYTGFDETDKFTFGYVSAVDEDWTAIHMISPDGFDDGIHVTRTDMVIRADVGGLYGEKMNKLIDGNPVAVYDFYDENGENGIMLSALLYAKNEKYIVSLELVDSGIVDITGFIDGIKDGMCRINVIDEYGAADGVSYVPVENITIVTFRSADEKRLEKLAK